MKNRNHSQKVYDRLCSLMPGGVNSPVRACKDINLTPPLVAELGSEDYIVDADGNHYIDYCCSWGSLIHGHAHPEIIKSTQQRLMKGTSFGITTAIEGELANAIIETVDSIERIRFVSSGTEATMSAARLARGYTKKDIIIKFSGNYHGHADFFLVQAGSGVFNLSPTSSSAGIPNEIVKQTLCLPYNDIEAFKETINREDLQGRIAAVIIEPIAANMGVVPADKEFIHCLREETIRHGALLIFDEVVTGFRIGLKGAQDYFKVRADLICLGKIIGGGFPAAAFGGKKEIMDFLAPLGPVYQAGTLSGNPIAMEAGLQAIKLAKQPNFYEELNKKTDLLLNPIDFFIKENHINACIQRVGSMFTLFFGKKHVKNSNDAKQIDGNMFKKFFTFMLENGIYIPPSAHEAWFVSQVHKIPNLIKTRDVILDFFKNHAEKA